MSTRHYPAAERYESIERDYYHRDGYRGSYDELDTEITTASDSTREYVRERERAPRRDWGRQPEVVRDRELVVRRGERDRYRRDIEHGHDEDEVDVVTTTVRREKSRERPREVVREIVREKREPSRERPREVVREIVREVREPPPPPPPQREVVREIVREVRDDHHRHRSPPRHRDDEIDVTVRREERGGGRRSREAEEVDLRVVRRDDHHRDWDHGRGHDYDVVDERETVRLRERSRSRHRGGRDAEEEIVMTRRRRGDGSSDSSPRRHTVEKEKIIIKKTKERSPSPPTVVRETVQIVRPPIVQPIVQEVHEKVITHHHHVDHGVVRARSRSPLPPPKPKEETIEVDIRHRHGRSVDEDDIAIGLLSPRDAQRSLVVRGHSRSRSRSRSRLLRDESDDYESVALEAEARALNARALERAYAGEAYDGATRHWTIVDVPPGTQRVRMDGAGGGAQEITWQRYNGVRRSRFIAGDRTYDDAGSGRLLERERALERRERDDMWTEITKDLVSREAIEMAGLEYEETEYFYYVMEYLQYEEVQRLVQLSDDLRRERRRRIRQIERERAEMAELRARNRRYEDRIYEREVVLDRRRR